MKHTYFHGTSEDNLRSILKNGLNPLTEAKLWHPSGQGVYLWSPDALVETGEAEGDNDKDFMARERAYDSAQAAMAKGKKGRCVVFEIELDSDSVEPDYSCQNMDGAVVCLDHIPPSAIKQVWISPDLSLLKGYFMAQVLQNELFVNTFSEMEKQIAKIFLSMEFYFESSDYPLTKYRAKLR
jgi:hypothetical protein